MCFGGLRSDCLMYKPFNCAIPSLIERLTASAEGNLKIHMFGG